MAHVRTPRSRWIDAGLDALAMGGPGAVRIEPLAQALGVTKGGFYWHFDDRGALLEELISNEIMHRVERELDLEYERLEI
jgi:AcrR family transcriptional regulator